jgi:hypothetical protein
VRLDSDETPDDRNLTVFWVILDRVILYLIGWADRLVDGPTGLAAYGVDYSASVSTPRWHRVVIP